MGKDDNKFKYDPKYITLKQAAEISGYSADYIGQLIRQGKIIGKQVYLNMAWVTTEAEVKAYLQRKNSNQHGSFSWSEIYNRNRIKFLNYVFSFSPISLLKSFIFSLLIIIFIFTTLLFINLNRPDVYVTDNNANIEVTHQVEVDAQGNKLNETSIPIVP